MIVYAFNESTGQISAHSECMVPIGHAARHLAVHPDGKRIYVDEEAGNMVTAYDWDSEAGTLTRTQTLTTLRSGDAESAEAHFATSECELSPDARVLHVSAGVSL